jgi:hypothetical protein
MSRPIDAGVSTRLSLDVSTHLILRESCHHRRHRRNCPRSWTSSKPDFRELVVKAILTINGQ